MKKIDLRDWIESGGGARGTSYFHKTDPDLMLKFDNLQTNPSNMNAELEAASVAYSLGISTPRPGELVTDGRRFGLTFRRVPNKISYASAIGRDPQRLPELATEFARQSRNFHRVEADKSRMRNVKDIYRAEISANGFREKNILKRGLELLDSLPDASTCLHGDLHIGNAIISGGKTYFIDMGNFSYGNPLFDLAMMKCACHLANIVPGFFSDFFHCEPSIADDLWLYFIKAYFDSEGPIAAINVEEDLKPYVILRKLAMESETGMPLNEPALTDVYATLGE